MSLTEQVRNYTLHQVKRILSYPSDSAARASLARLRKGVGHVPGELPELWGEFLLELPEELSGYGVQVSGGEWAVYTAITMFALHQQGKDRITEPMHCENVSLGTAAGRLIKNESEDRERIAKHFYPVASAGDMRELSYHLRSLISLLRAESIPLDYGRLAADLFLFQNLDYRDQVKLRWGEDFCRFRAEKKDE